MLRLVHFLPRVIALLVIVALSFWSGRVPGVVATLAMLLILVAARALYRKKLSKAGSVRAGGSILTVLIATVSAIPVVGIGGFAANCQWQRYTTNRAFNPVLKQFDAVYFIDEATKPITEVSKGGDCVDSRPSVSVRKTQTVHRTSNQLLADLDSALAKQGYAIDRDQLRYNYHGSGESNDNTCVLEIRTQLVAEDTLSPYRTFALTLRSDKQTCNQDIITTKNYTNIPITSIALYAQKD